MRLHRLAIAATVANLALLVAVLAQGHWAAAMSDAQTLRARAIELVDEGGRIRAQLNVEADGEVVFRLRDASGEIRMKLGAAKDGSGLLLLGESAEPGIHMLVKDSGTTLTLANRGGQRRLITP